MTLHAYVEELNRHDLSRYLRWRVGGHHVGWVRPAIAARLARHGGVFVRASNELRLTPALDAAGSGQRTRAVAEVLAELRREGAVPGWRDEPYPISPRPGGEPLLVVERAALGLFGARGCGVHVNGFVRDGGGVQMWLGRRASDKPTWPGLLDQVVAGGQPATLGLRQNLVKEAAEEAGIDPSLAARARATGTVSYVCDSERGLRPDLLYCFDLELPADFTPRNRDGEVAAFERVDMPRLRELLAAPGLFKPNSALVAIDFLVRRGLIEADTPGYAALVAGLHMPAPFEDGAAGPR